MKSYDDTVKAVMSRVYEYRECRKRRQKEMIILSVAVACVIIIASVVIAGGRRNDKDRYVYSDPINDDAGKTVTAGSPTPDYHPEETAKTNNTANPTVTPKNSPTQKPTQKPTTQPTQKPTDTPKPTPTQKPTATPQQTDSGAEPEPTNPVDDFGASAIGKLYLEYRAFNMYNNSSEPDTKFYFKFDSAEYMYLRDPVIKFRHDGMTFKEWESANWNTHQAAQAIFVNIRDNNIRTEYGVDTSKYPWTEKPEVKKVYGDWYKYLPSEWYELMDDFYRNYDAWWDAWDACMKQVAEEDAKIIGAYATGVKIVSNGSGVSGYNIQCTITKANLEKLGYATPYKFIVNVVD